MAKIAEPTRKPEVNVNPLVAKFREFISYKKRVDEFTKKQNEIKAELNDYVEEHGEVDDKGHVWVTLPEEVDGYVSMQRQRRVSQSLDIDTAILTLTKRGLADRCIRSVPTVDEDEIMSCLYEGKLTETEVDAMFPKKITWAFIPSKG
jgi:hypothetical protein